MKDTKKEEIKSEIRQAYKGILSDEQIKMPTELFEATIDWWLAKLAVRERQIKQEMIEDIENLIEATIYRMSKLLTKQLKNFYKNEKRNKM